MSRVTQVRNLARAGYFARGITYTLVGYFSFNTASGTGTTSVLEQVEEMPAGTILLALVGLGLLGYGLFRLYGAIIDIQGEGSDAKGYAKRGGHVASGLAHLYLAYFAVKTAFGGVSSSGGGSSGGNGAGDMAQGVAAWPGGNVLLILIGIGFLGAAVSQGVKAWTGKFMQRLDADAPRFAEYVGRAGYAARTVVFAVLGYTILTAVLNGNPSAVGGIGKVLDSLRDMGWVYNAVAIGLLLFGIFSFVMSRYRTIRNEDVLERLKAATR